MRDFFGLGMGSEVVGDFLGVGVEARDERLRFQRDSMFSTSSV